MRLETLSPFSPRAEATWRLLDAKAKPSYFLTWAWVENWLACLPRSEAPPLVVVTHDDRPVAACFIAQQRLRRHGFVASRALYLNTTGRPAYDQLCLEQNGLLTTDPNVSLGTIVEALPQSWDEVFLPALEHQAFAALADRQLPAAFRVRIDRVAADHYVDLARVREQGYVPLLGASTRAQLRKAERHAGELAFEVANSVADATAMYDELVALHQASWNARGQPGAFADPWFDRFHRRLIERQFESGDILLTRLRADGETIGCLYSFIAAGRVLFYQSGLASTTKRHVKPGYLCHARTIEHCAARGLAVYDMLGGDARYKQELATHHTQLVWARVQRRRLRFAIEDRARACVHWLRRTVRSRRLTTT